MFLKIKKIGSNEAKIRLIWLHGWGQNHKSFLLLADLFGNCQNILVDMAGFGDAPLPDKVWDTKDYAKDLFDYLQQENSVEKTYIIGHSFGCRVALRLSHQFDNVVDGLILISAAGLKKKRSISFKIKSFILRWIGKILQLIDYIFDSEFKKKYADKFGSADYRNAKGLMRNIFVKVINEDLSQIAGKIRIPTILIFGQNDQETPPQFGKRYNKMLINSQYFELPNFDHYNILSQGRYQLQNIISNFIKNNDNS